MFSKALEEIKQFEESKDSIASNPAMVKKLTMVSAKLPTIYSGGDDDLKTQNQKLKEQVDDLKAKISHLEQ